MANLMKSNPSALIKKAQNFLEKYTYESSQTEVVEQSPVWLRASLWTLMATAGFGIGWLALAQTEEVVVATGKLEPIGNVKEVRVPLNGVVDQLLIKEGQQVKKGQTLLRLDTEASSERKKTLSQNVGIKQNQLSLKQEELKRYLLLNNTKQDILKSKVDIQRKVVDRFVYLESQGASSEIQLLQQREKLEQIEGELLMNQDDRERQRAFLEQQIEEIKTQLGDLGSQLTEQQVRLRYQEIKAPVDGMIFELEPTSTGYVAQPGVPVLKVVPFSALEAQVTIPSKSIGFVRLGQKVALSIDSFPATDFGVLEGSVKRIGSDALPPEPSKGINDYRFPAEIELSSQQLKLKNGVKLPLQVGMSLTANIKLRKVSYLQLLLGGFKDKTSSLNQI